MVLDIRILGIVRDIRGESVEGGLRVSHIHVDARDFDPRLDEEGEGLSKFEYLLLRPWNHRIRICGGRRN